MAAFYMNCGGLALSQDEATATLRTITNVVNTAEAQVVTVSKNGGAFGATAGTTNAAITGTTFVLTIHEDDLDTPGEIAFLSTGATDTLLIYNIRVIASDVHDPEASMLAALLAGMPFIGGPWPLQQDEAVTIYWYQSGTLPANCVVTIADTPANSVNAPATEVGQLRSLLLDATEVAALGPMYVHCTTTGDGACSVGLQFNVTDMPASEPLDGLVTAVAAAILATPANLLDTDADGAVILQTDALDAAAVATSGAVEIGDAGWHGMDRVSYEAYRPRGG